MQRDRTDEPEESQRSRPSSRRSSVSLPHKNSLKRDKDRKPPPSPAHSAHSTPKRNARPSLDFMVTGKQILKRVDRANSLPGSSRRRAEPPAPAPGPCPCPCPATTAARRIPERAESAASREPSPDMSLDLSQISNFESCKFPLATSTPKSTQHEGCKTDSNRRSTPVDGNYRSTVVDGNHRSTAQEYTSASATQDGARCSPARHKPRSASLQHIQQPVERRTTTQQSVDSSTHRSDLLTGRSHVSADGGGRQSDPPGGGGRQSDPPGGGDHGGPTRPSRDSTFSCSRDSLFKSSSSASPYRCGAGAGAGAEWSWLSAEGSSGEPSPRAEPRPAVSSCCSHSWAERTMADLGGVVGSEGCAICAGGGGGAGAGAEGEWSSFWADYGGRAPGYDRCPTPYRELDASEFEFADRRARSPPDSLQHIGHMIRAEGLRLAPHEARRVLQCAHLLGGVLSRAAERALARDDRRRTLTLNLKSEASERSRAETAREPRCSEVTTQTDISLPNTKSAPRIFENILRQLSKSSLDEPDAGKVEGHKEE